MNRELYLRFSTSSLSAAESTDTSLKPQPQQFSCRTELMLGARDLLKTSSSLNTLMAACPASLVCSLQLAQARAVHIIAREVVLDHVHLFIAHAYAAPACGHGTAGVQISETADFRSKKISYPIIASL